MKTISQLEYRAQRKKGNVVEPEKQGPSFEERVVKKAEELIDAFTEAIDLNAQTTLALVKESSNQVNSTKKAIDLSAQTTLALVKESKKQTDAMIVASEKTKKKFKLTAHRDKNRDIETIDIVEL